MVRSISSWLSGPQPADPGVADKYPGQALGLPETGPGSLARTGRRLLALLIDYLIAVGISGFGVTAGVWTSVEWFYSFDVRIIIVVIWLILGAVSVRLFGFSPGQYALGLLVVPTDGRLHTGFGRAIVRGLLLALVIPALFSDADGRGLHDKLTFTAVVKR